MGSLAKCSIGSQSDHGHFGKMWGGIDNLISLLNKMKFFPVQIMLKKGSVDWILHLNGHISFFSFASLLLDSFFTL